MKVFLTGATGFIGTRIIQDLLEAGHTVLGLTRSEEGAKKLQAAGVEVHRGNIEDLDSLRKGAEKADGVIHCAMNHDFSQFVKNCEDDKKAIIAMGEVLVGSKCPFLVTSGTGVGSNGPGKLATEDQFDTEHPNPRIGSELAGGAASEKGFTAYLGEGKNRWPAAHVNDVARLYRLALEKNVAGSRYNAVAEEGITAKEIAEVTAKGLKQEVKSLTPEEAQEYFGWMAMFAGMDLSASSKLTRERLGWTPTGPGLIADLER